MKKQHLSTNFTIQKINFVSMKALLILGLFISLQTFGQQAVKSDAVYQNIVREYILNTDGSMQYHFYKKLKLNTPYAYNRLYGETFIIYNPEFQSLKINKAETIQADGSHVKVPENAFNEILPRMAAHAPAYNNLRELVITHTGLEVGAIIELDYTLTSKAGYLPGMTENIELTEDSPVDKEVIIVKIPGDQPLNFHVFNLRTAPEIKDAKGSKDYIFTFNALPENTHEVHQPANHEHLPRLVYSSMDQEALLTYLNSQAAFDLKTNDAMKLFVKSAKAKSKSDRQFILALQKELNENMNTWYIPLRYSAYKLRTPVETWESNGGTAFEKSLLLTALIREGGINAQPAFVFPGDLYQEKAFCPGLASEIVVAASPRESEQMFISAYHDTDQNCIYSLSGKTVVYADRKNSRVEKINDVFENKVVCNGTFSLSDDFKLSGKMEVLLSENRNPYYSLLSDSSLINSFVSGGISKSDIIQSNIINSAQYRSLMDYHIDQKEHLHQQADYYFWELPAITKGTADWHIAYLNSQRISPLELPYPIDEQYSITIALPAGVKLINPYALIERKTDFGELVISISQKENKVEVKGMFAVQDKTIAPANYAEFKAMYDLWTGKNFRRLIFKK